MRLDRKYLSMVVSYSTRPMRDYEKNGVHHWFITDEEADELLKDKDNIIAYTEINGVRYFTTKDNFKKDNIYIVDPNGIKYMKDHLKDKIIKVIYVHAPDNVRDARAAQRSESFDVYKRRCEDEKVQFGEFELNHDNYDLFINNKDGDLDYSVHRALDFVRQTYTDHTLYLVVGKTCSGKDTIVQNLIHLFH